MNHYFLGQGTSGQVVLHQREDSMFAIKKVKLENEHGVAVDAIREARILTQLHHPRIVEVYNVHAHDKMLHMEMEFLPMSLREVLIEPLTENTCTSFAHDLLTAIEYCHSQSIIHRDVKPENLLIGQDGKLKLVDFGLARETLNLRNPYTCEAYTPQMVTLWYRAPEILLAQPYGPAVDIWSTGCVIAEMLTANPLFKAHSEIEMLQLILRSSPNGMQADEKCLAEIKHSDLRELIAACLEHPQRRVTAQRALHLPWSLQCENKKRPRTNEQPTPSTIPVDPLLVSRRQEINTPDQHTNPLQP